MARPQNVLDAMNKIQNPAPAPQSNLPPAPQVGPVTGATATNLATAPKADAATQPKWKNYGGTV